MLKLPMVALVGWASIYACNAQDFSLLPVKNGRSTVQVFLRPQAFGPLLAPGKRQSSLGLDVINNFRIEGRVADDTEIWKLTAHSRWRSGAGEWMVSLPFLSRGPGILDPLIDWWHDSVIQFDTPLRDQTPRFRSEVIEPGSRRYGSATGFGDAVVAYGQAVGGGVGRAWLKVPTGDPSRLLGSGAFDFSLTYEQTWQIAPRLFATGLAGVTFQGKPRELKSARGIVPSAILGLSWQKNSRDLWQWQIDAEASPTVTGERAMDQRHTVISLGYTRRLGNGDRLTAYFTEDGDFYWLALRGVPQVGPDFALGFRYTWAR